MGYGGGQIPRGLIFAPESQVPRQAQAGDLGEGESQGLRVQFFHLVNHRGMCCRLKDARTLKKRPEAYSDDLTSLGL